MEFEDEDGECWDALKLEAAKIEGEEGAAGIACANCSLHCPTCIFLFLFKILISDD